MDRELDYSVSSSLELLNYHQLETKDNEVKLVLYIDCRFRVYGDPPVQRSVEDIAFSVARFFSKNGSHVNYYMVDKNTV